MLQEHSSKLLDRFGSELSDLEQEWKDGRFDFSFRARGFGVSGGLNVGDEEVELEVNLPFLARLMEGQIKDRVVQAMQEIFQAGTGG